MNSTISVIVPVYNAENCLEKCVESITRQTYRDLEIILIDDGSSDSSSRICDHFSSEDGRIRVCHIANSGPAKARNTGIQMASGRYLAFVDADDYIEPDMYETLLSELKEREAQMVICNWYIQDDVSGETKKSNIGEPTLMEAYTYGKTVACDDMLAGGGYLWNRLIDCAGINRADIVPFREKLSIYEDKIWILDNLKNLDKILLIDYTGYHYVISEGSLCHSFTNKKRIDLIEAWRIIFKTGLIDDSPDAMEWYLRTVRTSIWDLFKNKDRRSAAKYWHLCRPNEGKNTRGLSFKDIVKSFVLEINSVLYQER